MPGEGDCDFCGPRAAVDPKTGKCVFCDRRRGGPTFNETCKCPIGHVYITRYSGCICTRGSFPAPLNETPELCLPCPEGFRQRQLGCVRRCLFDQPAPHFHYWNGEKCVKCADGFNAVDGRCVPLPCGDMPLFNTREEVCKCNGKKLPDGICQSCPFSDGFVYDKEKDECICREGLVLKDGVCVPCPAGFMAVNGGECTPCQGRRYKPEGERLCLYCAEASLDVVGAKACVKAKCRDDEFETQDGRCMKCKVGQRVKNGVCVDCGMEEVSAGGRRGYCSKCGAGSVPNAERSACVPSRR